MKLLELMQEIEKTYQKHFTDSKIFISYRDNLYRSIYIKCIIANDKKESINGYYENDMLNLVFYIESENGELPQNTNFESDMIDNLVVKFSRKNYLIKPIDKYCIYNHKTLKFRKIKGNSKKIITKLDIYFSMLKNELLLDIENDIIHDNHIELLTSKIKKAVNNVL